MPGTEGAASGTRLLRPTEVASHLGVPLATLYSWRYRGHGPPAIRSGDTFDTHGKRLPSGSQTRLDGPRSVARLVTNRVEAPGPAGASTRKSPSRAVTDLEGVPDS